MNNAVWIQNIYQQPPEPNEARQATGAMSKDSMISEDDPYQDTTTGFLLASLSDSSSSDVATL